MPIAMVKSVLIISICSIFLMESLFPGVELADLSALPELLSHFEKHKVESPKISFLDFLYLHYGDSNHRDQDPKNHGHLPFSKNHHRVLSSQIVQDLFSIEAPLEFTFLMIIEGVTYSEEQEFVITTSIWQPPKI